MTLLQPEQIHDLLKMIRTSNRTYVLGNGGSYANSGHLVNDLLFCGIKAFTIDPATLSAFANDYGWEQALARWIRIVGTPHDLLIALSGSGTSKNILNAVIAAQTIGMSVCRVYGNTRKESMSQAEEYHLQLGHELRQCLQPKTS